MGERGFTKSLNPVLFSEKKFHDGLLDPLFDDGFLEDFGLEWSFDNTLLLPRTGAVPDRHDRGGDDIGEGEGPVDSV